MINETIHRCPSCTNKLYARKGGYVCKNHQCPLYHKLGGGWIRSFSGTWFYQDTKAYKDMKYGISPYINYDRVVMGLLALAGYKKDKNEE